MLAKLPELFGRIFLVSYFLPVAVFLLASIPIASGWAPFSALLSLVAAKPIVLGGMAMGAWVMALVVLTFNRGAVRLLEGYGEINPLRVFKRFQVRAYRKLEDTIRQVDSDVSGDPKLEARRIALYAQRASRFPDSEAHLLPTSFGNRIRAFEVYPRVMYGLEGIDGWFRLLGVTPDSFQRYLDEARSRVDLWVNIALLSGILLVVWLVAWLHPGWFRLLRAYGVQPTSIDSPWIPIALGLVVALAYRLSVDAAAEWGNWVRSAFDLFIGDLARQMRIDPCPSSKCRRTAWTQFSQAVAYRLPRSLDQLRRIGND